VFKLSILLLLYFSLYGEVINSFPSPQLLKENITIIDIRTAPEWRDTGVIKNSILLTFFDAQGGYNLNAFLHEMNKHVSKNKPFALICHTGSRTKILSAYLGNKLGYHVINLQGGIAYWQSRNYPLVQVK